MGKSFRWSPSDPLHTNRFRWKSSFSIRERLRKISVMLDEGVESRSDGVHRIHWKRIDSDGKAPFSIRERLTKISLMMDEEVERRSNGVHRINWTRIDSDGKVSFLFVRDFE